ncbi:MAG: hypothetical protein ISS19_17540 [Bacteroidales bacterium]|nr:hypothetical protein [Bacteroidales bacterium]
MRFRRILSKSQLLLLMPAVMWLFTNALINTHYHYLSDGQVISHAHPYNKTTNQGSPFKSHQHSKTQLIFLSIIDKSDVVIAGFIILGLLSAGISQINIFPPSETPVKVCYQVHHYRGPPA